MYEYVLFCMEICGVIWRGSHFERSFVSHYMYSKVRVIPYMHCGVSISYILCMSGRYLFCDGSADFLIPNFKLSCHQIEGN